jgi:toxin secretion/phage lysis holin
MEGRKYMATEPTTNSFFQAIAGGGFATLSYLLGGIDNLIVCLGIFMMIDYVTGIMVGFSYKSVSSQRAYRGAFKKVGMMMMILVAVQIDIITNNDVNFMRNSIIMILIGVEGISLLENLGKLGVPIPAVLTDSLERLKEAAEKRPVKEVETTTTTVVKEKEVNKEEAK